MTTRNTLTDREERGSRMAAFDAAITGKTAKLRMMERLGNARSIDDVGPIIVVKAGEGTSLRATLVGQRSECQEVKSAFMRPALLRSYLAVADKLGREEDGLSRGPEDGTPFASDLPAFVARNSKDSPNISVAIHEGSLASPTMPHCFLSTLREGTYGT